MRFAAAGVPSQTITTPACCGNRLPTRRRGGFETQLRRLAMIEALR